MKLIILDRDGTINHDSDEYIKSPAEWKPIKGSLEGMARLTQAGYRIAVATNQSGIALGLLDTRTLFAIHDTLLRALAQVGGRVDAWRWRGASTCRSGKRPWLATPSATWKRRQPPA
jgi:D-glycero-D-manno-heptose 1,7-bisphosphate phosphatase